MFTQLKILRYISSLDLSSGGPTTNMQALSKALGKLAEVHFATHHSEQEVAMENATVHYLPSSLLQLHQIKKQWIALLNDIQPNIVHVHGCWLPLCALTQKWAQELGYKVVLTPHGMLEPWIMQRHYWTRKFPALCLYQKAAIKKADFIHATAESEKQNLLQLGYNDKIKIIPNGLEVEQIPLKSTWKKTKKILYLSRIHPKKGIELLIQAVARLKNDLQDYQLIVAGEGEVDYVNTLKNKIQSQGLSDLFYFVDGVYGTQKWQLYQEADIFILPTYSENFGFVIAEALASGTPVITTTGTPWEELNTYHCGWWIDAEVEAIAKTLQEAIVLKEEDYRQMGLRGRELIQENYSIESVAEKMMQLYE